MVRLLIDPAAATTSGCVNRLGAALSGISSFGSGIFARLKQGLLLAALLGSGSAFAQTFTVDSFSFSGGNPQPVASTQTATISYSCTGGASCNGVQLVYQAQHPIALYFNIASGIVSGLPGAVSSAVVNQAANTLTINLNPIPAGSVSTITFPVKSYAGSTGNNTVTTQTVTATSSNAGSDSESASITYTASRPIRTAIYGPTTAAQDEPQNFSLESVDNTPDFSFRSNVDTPGARTLIGPTTITYTAPAGAVVNSAQQLCTRPIGDEFVVAGNSTSIGTVLNPLTAGIAGNVATWSVPTGQMLVYCLGYFAYDSYGTALSPTLDQMKVNVTYPTASFPVGTVTTASINVAGQLPGEAAGSTNVTSTFNTTILAPYRQFILSKSRLLCSVLSNRPQIPALNDFGCWTVVATNASPDPLKAPVTQTNWVLEDTLPPGTRPTVVGVVSTGRQIPYVFAYELSGAPGVWISSAPMTAANVFLCDGVNVTVTQTPGSCALPTPTAGNWVTRIRVTVPGPIFPNEAVSLSLSYQQLNVTSTGAPVATGDPVTNAAIGDGSTSAGPNVQQSTSFTENIQPGKGGRWAVNYPAMISPVGIGSTVSCTLSNITNVLTNAGVDGLMSNGSIVNPVQFISLPKDMANYALSGPATSTSMACPGMPNQTIVNATQSALLTDYQGSGRTGFLLSWPGVTLPMGCIIVPNVSTTITAQMTADNIAGPAACATQVFSDANSNGLNGPWNIAPTNSVTSEVDGFDLNKNGNTTETVHTRYTPFTFPALPSFEASKAYSTVNGEAGGSVTTTITLKNSGNDTANAFDIVDVLPFVGDVQHNGTTRSSSTALQLTGAITGLPPGVTAYYSTDSNPCRSTGAGKNPSVPGAAPVAGLPAGCTLTTWNATAPGGVWAAIKAIRFVGLAQSITPFTATGFTLPISFAAQINPAAQLGQMANNDASGSVALNVSGNALSAFGTNVATLTVGFASLSGRVFNDLDSSGVQNGAELGLANAIVVITCTAGPCLSNINGTTFSMLTNVSGDYAFTPGAAGTVFANSTATGAALASFQGLLSGTWTVTETPAAGPPFYSNVTRNPGTVNAANTGAGTGRSITTIVIPVGGIGINYNFGELLNGSLTSVTKTVSPNAPATLALGYPAGQTFPITIDCNTGGTTFSLNLANAASSGPFDLPANAVCTVSESALPTPNAGYGYGTPSITLAGVAPVACTTTPAGATGCQQFTVPNGASITATVTNPLNAIVGGVTTAKQVTGPLAGLAAGQTFPITLDCGTASTANLSNGASATNAAVAAGSTCRVFETAPPAPLAGYAYGTPTIAVVGAAPAACSSTPAGAVACSQFTVAAAAAIQATVTNPLQSGSLTINKTVTIGLPQAATFNFTVSCIHPTTGVTPIDVANATPTINIASGNTTGNVIVSPIATGSTCSVTETTPTTIPNYTWGTTPGPNLGIAIGNGTTASTSFTNTLTANPGTLTVTKTITGPAGFPSTTGNFPFTVGCQNRPATYSSLTGSVDVSTGNTGSTTVSIPAGSTDCVVAETLASRPAAPAGYAWGIPTYAQPTSTALAPGGTIQSTITNPLTPLDPPFISKAARLISSSDSGRLVEWTITVINNSSLNAGQAPLPFAMTDPLPAGMSFVSGSVSCTPTSANAPGNASTVSTCDFNAPVNATSLNVTGNLAYTANTDPATAPERVTIVFQGLVTPGLVVQNVACAANSAIPNDTECATAVVSAPALPVPVNALWMLLLLMAGVATTVATRGKSNRRI